MGGPTGQIGLMHRLHSEYVGEGWGYGVSELCVWAMRLSCRVTDRVLDYHIKFNSQDDFQVTQHNVSLDHFAKLHAEKQLRYHPFNT